MPLLSGGATVAPHRVAVATGFAANMPAHRSKDAIVSNAAGAGGVVPVVLGRAGVARELDLGVVFSGTALRADLRKRWQLNGPEALTRLSVMLGVSSLGGWVDPEGDGRLARIGAEVPLVFSVDASSVVELWAGARVGVEHLFGDVRLQSEPSKTESRATGLRAGPVIGLAVGFRNLAALAELTVFIEHWRGSHAGQTNSTTGVTFVPSAALRYQL